MTGRERKLDAEERILWGKVARSTTPLKDKAVQDDWLPEAPREDDSTPRIVRQAGTFRQHPPPATHNPPQPPAFDRPQRRKLEKGRIPIEARIDLHGLFQAEAHTMLLSFLAHAHARGLRHACTWTHLRCRLPSRSCGRMRPTSTRSGGSGAWSGFRSVVGSLRACLRSAV